MSNEVKYGELQGVDVDIEISLFEYGIAWQFSEDGKEICFWYGVRSNGELYDVFDWACVATDIDLREEYCWADFLDVLRFVGMWWPEWDKTPLEYRIYDLIQYYGISNVFSECYCNGFRFDPELGEMVYNSEAEQITID